ncbi:HTH domain-containing protein [Prescottella defluvii]|nr:HTH domain-containing protein [Prescottella defluvii]
MLKTSARLLELLSLLQLRRDWTSSEIADRLEVSTRTVRGDISKLRSLGYLVDARPGVAGGYRLAPGAVMPPLLLNDDEAVAVAVGLSALATGRAGAEEESLTALAKLEQVLPARLRQRVGAVREATNTVPELHRRWTSQHSASSPPRFAATSGSGSDTPNPNAANKHAIRNRNVS